MSNASTPATSPQLRVLIVDDEPLARMRLATLLAEHAHVTVVGECENGQEAIDAIASQAPDLVFLDIHMPEVDGFDVIQQVGLANMPAVIFVTAYDQYALQAFEAHAVDYLLKPFEIERFEDALDRAVQWLHRPEAAPDDYDARLSGLLDTLKPAETYKTRLMIKSRNRAYLVRTADIDWVEADGNYVCLHVGQQTYVLRQTMAAMEAQLDPEQFMRIHRSTIVNMDRIAELRPTYNGEYEVLLNDRTRLTLSRGYRERLERFAPR